ncbi:MAG: hypothetical protein IID45_02695 [Planctomycetes bacterium]|nr:hypothetical protein [Planctomycetota bacterium]
MAHFLPTNFQRDVIAMLRESLFNVQRPVDCSEPLVESMIVESSQGTVIPLVNWTGKPLRKLRVTVNRKVPSKSVTLSSGKPVRVKRDGGKLVLEFDLDAADALIFR